MSETRTLHYKVHPALRAYVAYLDKKGLTVSLEGFDLFRANYRARDDDREAARPATDELEGGGA